MKCPTCKKDMRSCGRGLYECPTHHFMDYDEIKAMREAIKAKRRKKA